MNKIETIVLLGKTGSGKGTQAKFLSKKLGFKKFVTGDRFREMKQLNNPLGRKVKEVYEGGLLMPHWLASFIFEEALFNLEDGEGIVFEGTGRTLEESKLFDDICQWLGRDYIAFHLDVSDEEVIKRQQERKRDELDTLEKIKKRLEEYQIHTAPAIDYFRQKGNLVEIDGNKSIEDVQEDILKHL